MSGKFDFTIRFLKGTVFHGIGEEENTREFKAAIAVLEQAERWEPLIKAAGRVHPDDVCWMASCVDAKNTNDREVIGGESVKLAEAWKRVLALLDALPDSPEDDGRGRKR